MNTLLLRRLLPAIVLLLSTLQISAADLGQPVRADGMELFYGVSRHHLQSSTPVTRHLQE